jgi:hypothetical protein
VNRRNIILIGSAFAIMAAVALFVGNWQNRQRLGEPGVRVVNQIMYGMDVSPRGTNTFHFGTNGIYLPETVLDYESRSVPIMKVVLDALPKDTTFGQRFYTATNGFQIQTTVVLMGTDRTSIHQPQYCLNGAGWRIEAQEETTIPMDRPMNYELPVMKLKLKKTHRDANGQEWEFAGVLLYWFVADGLLTASHRERMWWLGKDLLRTGILQRWAYVTEFAVCRPGEEEMTFARMAEFVRASVPEFQLAPDTAREISRASSDTAERAN